MRWYAILIPDPKTSNISPFTIGPIETPETEVGAHCEREFKLMSDQRDAYLGMLALNMDDLSIVYTIRVKDVG